MNKTGKLKEPRFPEQSAILMFRHRTRKVSKTRCDACLVAFSLDVFAVVHRYDKTVRYAVRRQTCGLPGYLPSKTTELSLCHSTRHHKLRKHAEGTCCGTLGIRRDTDGTAARRHHRSPRRWREHLGSRLQASESETSIA